MIKLELNKIPGYTLAPDYSDETKMVVTFVFSNGMTYPTCNTMEELGFQEPKAEPEKEAVKEAAVHKVTEGTLLQVVAMLHGVKEIPR